jgi:hypothetical protein
MALPPDERNSTENELLDHYSVGADLGPIAGPVLSVAQETIGRPLLSRYPDLANMLAPSVFNFKTPSNTRAGAIDPYEKPTLSDATNNVAATVSGSLDNYPQLQALLGLTQEKALGGSKPVSPGKPEGIMEMLKRVLSSRAK